MEHSSRNSLVLPEIGERSKVKGRSLSKEKASNKKLVKLSPYKKLPIALRKKQGFNSTKSLTSSIDFSLNLNQAQSTLQALCDKLIYCRVPQTLIKVYSDLITQSSNANVGRFIFTEISDLSNNTAVVVQCVKSYKAWKDSLETIKEMVNFLGNSPGWVKLKDVVNECSSSLSTHILLALNLSELVLAWKEHMKGLQPTKAQIVYVNEDLDVFEEIKASCDFLLDSPLAQAFNLAKNDPFLMSCVKESPGHKKQNFNFTVERGKIFICLDKRVVERAKQVLVILSKHEEVSKTSEKKSTKLKNKLKQSGEVHKVAKLFTERVFLDCISILMHDLALEIMRDELVSALHSRLLHQSLNECLQEIVKQAKMEVGNEIGSKKADKLHLLNIIEAIVRNLVEEEVRSAGLESLCEEVVNMAIQSESKFVRNPEAKRRLTQISLNFEHDKLSEVVYHSLVDQFIDQDWLPQLVESSLVATRRKTVVPLVINNKVVEEADDFAMDVFTPGAHSPNEVRSEDEREVDSPLKLQNFEGPRKMFSALAINIRLARIEPLNEDVRNLESVLSDYCEELPKELEAVLKPRQIFEQAEKMCDCRFYWVVYEGNACGFYCYSINHSGAFVVHHISCLNYKIFEEFLSHFTELSGLSSGEVVLEFNQSVLSSKPLQNALKKTNFKKSAGKSEYVEFTQKTKNPSISPFSFKLSSVSALETKNSVPFNKSACVQMTQLGNRHSIISLILSFFKLSDHVSPEFDETPIRLQQDLNELLEIMLSLNFRSYPLFSILHNPTSEQISPLCAGLSVKSIFEHTHPSVCSLLNLEFSLVGASFVSISLNNSSFKYLKFSQSVVKVRVEDSTQMFCVPTNDPEISLFFIKSPSIKRELDMGLKVGKTDLFYNIDNLIKALQGEESVSEDFWVPCFEKNVQMKVPWIEGYSINSEVGNVVSGCAEVFGVCFKFNGPDNRTLRYESGKKKFIIDEDFVFGVYSKQVQSTLDSPLYAALVTKDDFISNQ